MSDPKPRTTDEAMRFLRERHDQKARELAQRVSQIMVKIMKDAKWGDQSIRFAEQFSMALVRVLITEGAITVPLT